MTRLALLSWLLSLCYPALALDQQPSPFAISQLLDGRGEVANQLKIYQSEPVRLALDIYSPTWFAKAPQVADFAVTGALVVRSETFATNFTRRHKGHSYTVQRREYTLFPQRPGRFVVPSAGIEIHVARPGSTQPQRHQVRSNALLFQVQPLPQPPRSRAVSDQRALAASQVDVQQRIVKADRPLYPGDAVQRRITVTANGSMSMLIPALHWPHLHGTRQQSELPLLDDTYNRGNMIGVRTENRSYTFTAPGQYTLPELQLHWWDSGQKQWRHQSIAARTVSIMPSPHTEAATSGAVHDIAAEVRHYYLQLNLTQQLATAATVLLLMLMPRLLQRWRRAWQQARHSERWRYWQLQYSSRYGRGTEIRQHYYDWQGSIDPARLPVTSTQLEALLAEFYALPDTERPAPQLRANFRHHLDQQRRATATAASKQHLNPWCD